MSVSVRDILTECCNLFSTKIIKKVRPWKEFFRGYKIPEWEWEHVLRRISTNLIYFSGNYILLFIFALLIMMISDPILTICILLISCCWIFLYSVYRQYNNTFENKQIIGFILFSIFCTLFLLSLFNCLLKVIVIIIFVVLFILLHSCFKKLTVKSRLALRSLKLPYQLTTILNNEDEMTPFIFRLDKTIPSEINNRKGSQDKEIDLEANQSYEYSDSDCV